MKSCVKKGGEEREKWGDHRNWKRVVGQRKYDETQYQSKENELW
jgi:hypothetical protein